MIRWRLWFPFVCCALNASAAIAVHTNGSALQTFQSAPQVSEWATQFIPGGAVSILTRDALDLQVQTVDATNITNSLTAPISFSCCSKLAIWADSGVLFPHTAMTRPTDVAATLFQATLRNDTTSALPALELTFDVKSGVFTIEEMGLRLYVSTDGSSNSWQFVREFNQTETVKLTLNLSAWRPTALLHLLWVDDNCSGEPDTGYAIANFVAVPVPPPLQIGRIDIAHVKLSWPVSAINCTLESKTSVTATNWQSVTWAA
jgi:hypothetical protein